eukprot:11637942-Alexandrium_andersonii.AAC.1
MPPRTHWLTADDEAALAEALGEQPTARVSSRKIAKAKAKAPSVPGKRSNRGEGGSSAGAKKAKTVQ